MVVTLNMHGKPKPFFMGPWLGPPEAPEECDDSVDDEVRPAGYLAGAELTLPTYSHGNP